MMSHALARKLLELPDQFVYIHPTDKNKAYPCDKISVRLNGIILTPKLEEEGGEQ